MILLSIKKDEDQCSVETLGYLARHRDLIILSIVLKEPHEIPEKRIFIGIEYWERLY